MQDFPGDLPAITAVLLARLRAKALRVHCITNGVAQNFTANMLLAAGVTPSMTIAPDEIGSFVESADALLVNLGTFDAERRQAIEVAVADASDGIPWVLDPVFVERSAQRAAFAGQLVARRPTVVRLNRAELSALAPDGLAASPVQFATENATTVALSGETDVVTDGRCSIAISNGHPWMARVTAMGCAGSALVAACLAVEENAALASAAALLMLGIAGEMAAERSRGPGTFAAAILDAVHALDQDTIMRRARVASGFSGLSAVLETGGKL